MSLKSCHDLIEQLLSEKNGKYKNSHQQLIYERGYLTGLLAKLANDDSFVKTAIKRTLKNQEK